MATPGAMTTSFEFVPVHEGMLRAVEDTSDDSNNQAPPEYVWNLIGEFLKERESLQQMKEQEEAQRRIHQEAVRFQKSNLEESSTMIDHRRASPQSFQRLHSPLLALSKQHNSRANHHRHERRVPVDPLTILVQAVQDKHEVAASTLRKQMDTFQTLLHFCNDRIQYLENKLNSFQQDLQRTSRDQILQALTENAYANSPSPITINNEIIGANAAIEIKLQLWKKLRQDLNSLDE